MRLRINLIIASCLAVTLFGLAAAKPSNAETISIEGSPSNTGYNVGTAATIHAAVRGLEPDASRYAVFAEIQYIGTTSVSSVEMDRQTGGEAGETLYTASWPIPQDAPTGAYSVVVKVEDRSTRKNVNQKKLRSFSAYRKLIQIDGLSLDKTFYTVGDVIQCRLNIQNLTDQDLKDLRIEFSNSNYPWISLYSTSGAGNDVQNPELALKVLRDHVDLPAHGEVTIPMMPAGVAAFLQGQQVAVMGAGGPARHFKVPPPEVDNYTVAVWNGARTILYDMQFTSPAIVRPPGADLPKPYSRNYTHPYNADIDHTKYREFYSAGEMSPVISVGHARTLYRPGDTVTANVTLKNATAASWIGLKLRAEIKESSGTTLHEATLADSLDMAPGETKSLDAEVWKLPESFSPGTYRMDFSLLGPSGVIEGALKTEIAVNAMPSSVLDFIPHEDDEHPYAGLIRAAVEAGIPVRVVAFTGGDVGECERYYDKPCGPNEAKEFGLVRMEETTEALEHMGLARDKVSFMGLPDGGSGAIWFQHISVSNPYQSVYLATDHAPYDSVIVPNLPYARDAVIDLVKKIIVDFHPGLIALPHPDERHVDHRTANWFVVKACQELLKEGRIDPQTVILADQAYGAGGYKPAPYHYEKYVVHLSGEVAALKQEMGWIYQSQDGNLAEGAKQTYDELSRDEVHYRIVDWQEHEGWNE